MAKILNLDALSTPQRELVLGGVTYPFPEMTVENFIETTRISQAISADATLADQISATVDMIVRSVPNLPRAALVGVSLKTLSVITAFVRGEDVDNQTDSAGATPEASIDEGTPAGN